MLRNQEKNKDNCCHRIHTETKVEMGRLFSKNEGQQVDHPLHRVATKEREDIKRMTKQDNITEKDGNTWIRKATDKRQWKRLMEGYILQ